MRAVTGKPIKLIGTGEKMDALEDFHPGRIASLILGMGDIVSLVEKAAENIDMEQAQRSAEKLRRGKFDLDDLRGQLQQMEKLGGVGGLMGMIPGAAKMKDQLANSGMNDKAIKRQVAIINSMTPRERRDPDMLKHSRKKRIAAGSGTSAEEINKLLKMHRGMADMMKMMGSGGKRGPMAGLANMLGLGGGAMGGMPQPSPEMLESLKQKMGGGLPEMPPGLARSPLPPGFSGLGAPRLPGLPGLGGPKLPFGFPFGGKKK